MAKQHKHNHGHEGHDHAHEDHHGHSHSGHGHSHAPASFGRAFAIGISLNIAFVAIEVIYGVMSNSMSLLADAGHNLSDVLGLVAAWSAAILTRRIPTPRYTYGMGKASILAALFNAVFLLVAVGMISWEAIGRFSHPEPIAGGMVMAVATVGIFINGLTAWLFMRSRKEDMNHEGAYLHMLGDAAVSAGVVIAGLVISRTGWLWLDPAVTLVIGGLIIWGTWGLLSNSFSYALAGVPEHINGDKVKAYLAGLKGVAKVHDLHIWPLSTTSTALTCHLVMPQGHPGDEFLAEAMHHLKDAFKIDHATMQVEASEGFCTLEPDTVV